MINLWSVFIGIITLLSFIKFIKKISMKDFINKKWLYFYVIIYTVIYVGMVYIFSPIITTSLSLVFIALGCKIFLNLSYKDLMFYSIIELLIAIILDMLIMYIFNTMMWISSTNYEIFRLIGTFIIALVFCVLGSNRKFVQFLNKLKKALYQIDSFLPILFLIIIIYLGLGVYCFDNINNLSIIAIILGASIFLAILIIIYIYQLSKILFLKENIKILSKNIELYINRIDEDSIIKHNIAYDLNAIKMVANSKAIKLIDEIIKKCERYKLPKGFKKIPSGINGIVLEKVCNLNANIHISFKNKIKGNIIEEVSAKTFTSYCEALGIALDNAVEAAEESNEKIIFVEIYENDQKIFTKIINTFKGEIDIDKLGTIRYTSKINGNGIGIFSILKMKKVKINTTIRGNKFKCILEIDKERLS